MGKHGRGQRNQLVSILSYRQEWNKLTIFGTMQALKSRKKVRKASRIIVPDKGKVKGMEAHKELQQKGASIVNYMGCSLFRKTS